MKLRIRALAITSAVISATAYVLGGILHVVSPWGAPALVGYIFHVDIIELGVPFAWDSFVVGIVLMAGVGAILGASTAWLYNAVVGREKIFGFAKGPVTVSKG